MKAAQKTFCLTYLTAILLLVAVAADYPAGSGGAGGGTGGPYTIGGNVAGLAAGESVVLQNNGKDNLTVSANVAFTFPTTIASGGMYAVTVFSAPANPAQTCIVTAGSGTATANVTGVSGHVHDESDQRHYRRHGYRASSPTRVSSCKTTAAIASRFGELRPAARVPFTFKTPVTGTDVYARHGSHATGHPQPDLHGDGWKRNSHC